jgi:hypothetical protein
VTPEEAVIALDNLHVDDPELAHSYADSIVLDAVPREVKDAYHRLVLRANWWASA